ncbi:MAG: type transporter [Bacteroidota bacterium]|nr:type transporter [Bacteroidota bacterium]
MVPFKTINNKGYTFNNYLKEVWNSRALALNFALRDLRIQYAQTYLGLLWSVLQPLTGLFIFYFFFQKVIHLKMNVPYSVFALTGMMGWFYFSQLIGQAGTCLMHNQILIKKMQFPRIVLPLSKAIIGLVEFTISFILLLILMVITDCHFSYKIIFLPLVVLANVVAGLSVGIWLSALTIKYRDFHHIIPYLIGFGIWITPVFYPNTMVPPNFTWIYYFHPVANVIALYRWIFIGWPVNWLQVASSFSIAAVLFIFGLRYFIKNEKFIADYL